ncbi:MAG: glycoside hydrolase family 88 protein [Bacteroidales bacterium]|nr:glycoside hydrolase family 88 protein [Bacteroidales bacterium]
MKKALLILLVAIISREGVFSQGTTLKVTDSNTALHALQPDYKVPYGPMKEAEIKAILDRMFDFIDKSTPAVMVDRQTKAPVTDLSKLTPGAVFEPGVFRLISYEWGVAYGAMLNAAAVTGDTKFSTYTLKRMELISKAAAYFKGLPEETLRSNNPVRSVLEPRALDDAGSMCAAMIKSINAGAGSELRPLVDNYISFVSTGQQRLADGTLSRNRPLPDALWLDDLYMSVPALAQMGALTGEKKYFDDACRQVIQFSERMFNSERHVFMHGWIQGMDPHPEFYWARCNGWAILAMSELLDVLPAGHEARSKILDLFRSHAAGLAAYQSGSGFWHQLMDRNDSYLETSATAIFTYCLAHGINKGWLNDQAFGPAAVLGWNAVSTKVNGKGEVEGTCVGTGIAFDPAFYYNRPVNVAAAHGYGPVVLAASEMIRLLSNFQVVINDSAVMFYAPGTDWRNNR